jgi:hypothetical protein
LTESGLLRWKMWKASSPFRSGLFQLDHKWLTRRLAKISCRGSKSKIQTTRKLRDGTSYSRDSGPARNSDSGYTAYIVSTPSQKGNALETAVAAIERHILRTSPGLREDTFVIESRKVICVAGVHHEIDIFVTIDSAPGYKSVYIFECKNWTDAVGKNEVMIFSGKIDAAQAQHGYFVAKSFTKDAEAQAKQDPRITLLTPMEHDPTGMPVPFGFHTVYVEIGAVAAKFRQWESPGVESLVDITKTRTELNGSSINLNAHLIKCAEEVCNESMRTFPSGTLSEGVYERSAEGTREFARGALILDGHDVKSVALSVSFKVHVFHPPVISHFQVVSRGRVSFLAPLALPGTTVQMSIISDAPSQK